MKNLEYFDFSNFDLMHIALEHNGLFYETTEHFFQAMKTTNAAHRRAIATAAGPGMAKGMGRAVQLRHDWKEIREDVMLYSLLHKFTPGTKWRKRLDDTKGFMLVEWNTWHDNIWGQCLCARCKNVEGKNFLGKQLVMIRDTEVEVPDPVW